MGSWRANLAVVALMIKSLDGSLPFSQAQQRGMSHVKSSASENNHKGPYKLQRNAQKSFAPSQAGIFHSL